MEVRAIVLTNGPIVSSYQVSEFQRESKCYLTKEEAPANIGDILKKWFTLFQVHNRLTCRATDSPIRGCSDWAACTISR